MWYAIPIVLTMSGITGILDFLDTSLSEYTDLVIKELLFYSFIITFLVIFTSKNKVRVSSIKISENLQNNRYFMFFTEMFVAFYIIYIALYKTDYTFNNELSNQQGGFYQVLSFFSAYFVSYLWMVIIYGSTKSNKKKAIILVFFLSLTLVISGSRIYLLSFIYLIYFISRNETRKLKIIRNYFITLVLIVGSLIALPYISASRTNIDREITLSSLNSNTVLLEELNTKLNNIAYSTVLIKYDGAYFAGFNPYIGSMFKFIPRLIWNNKPTATSYNTNVSGIPSRRVPELLGSDSDTYNTGVSACAVSIWQVGILTVFLSIILNVLLILLINNCLNNESYYIKTLGFMLVGFPQLVMLPTYGDNIIQKGMEALILIILLFMFRLIKIVRSYENSYI